MSSLRWTELARYLLATLLILIITIGLVSFQPYSRTFSAVFVTITAAAWLLWRRRSGRPVLIPWLAVALAAYAVFHYATAGLAPIPIASLERINALLPVGLALVLVLDLLRGGWRPETWENALVNVAVVFCLLELVLAFVWYRQWWAVAGRLSLPPVGYRLTGLFLGHANVLAGFLNLVIPIVLYRMIATSKLADRVLWLVGLGMFIATHLLASSRGGVLAGLGGAATTLALLYLASSRRQLDLAELRRLVRRHRLKLLAGLFAGALLAIVFIRQASTSAGHVPIAFARSGIWGPAWEIIRDAPLLGHGFGSFSVLYAVQTQAPPGFSTSHAHNLWLQLAAEGGLVGLSLGLAAIALAVRGLLSAWRSADQPARLKLAAYGGAGMSVLLHQQVDFLFESPGYLIGVIVLLALAHRSAAPGEGFRLPNRWAAPILALLLTIYCGMAAFTGRGAVAYWRGVAAGREQAWDQARELICQAGSQHPEISLYGFQCALALGHAAEATGDRQLLAEAQFALIAALENDPSWPVHWANLAAVQWDLGQLAQAAESIQVAVDRAPRNPDFALNAGLIYESLGAVGPATASYQQALANDPWLQLQAVPGSSPLLRTAFDSSTRESQAGAANMAATEGWQRLGSQDPVAAEGSFRSALEIEPGNAEAYAGLAVVELMAGHGDQAQRNSETALFLDPGSTVALMAAARISLSADQFDRAADFAQAAYDAFREQSESDSYYARTYLRYFLAGDKIPQLPRPGVLLIFADDIRQIVSSLRSEGDLERADRIESLIGAGAIY